ncbi:hypothetical protein [Sphaerisporangium aureirubrum]|uniref:DUF222 domain-containing protein n=1 Tax=Sphaerisporangium aureirubrum TaxID=1544736 RepID=A0ABW1NCC9_9ACTN
MPYDVHSDPHADDGHWRDAHHECARGDRCTDPRLIPLPNGTMHRAPALTPRAFCAADELAVGRTLTALPARWHDIHDELGVKGQAAGPRVNVTKSAPIPVSEAADALLREIVTTLTAWEERVARVARLSLDTETARWRRPHVAVAAAARTLATHLTVLLALPAEPMLRAVSLAHAATLPRGTRGLVHLTAGYADVILDQGGADAGLEILALHHRCRRHLGDTPAPARHLNGVACGECGYAELRELLYDDGDFAGAHCYECGTEYTADTYHDLVKQQEQDATQAGYRRRSTPRAPSDDDSARRA